MNLRYERDALRGRVAVVGSQLSELVEIKSV
jgi:hypothetical protein